jgi:hypothetical protein
VFAYICGEPGPVLSAFHLLWLTRRDPITRGESDRTIDYGNKTVVAGAPIGSLCSKKFGGNCGQAPPKVFFVQQLSFCKFGYVARPNSSTFATSLVTFEGRLSFAQPLIQVPPETEVVPMI